MLRRSRSKRWTGPDWAVVQGLVLGLVAAFFAVWLVLFGRGCLHA